MLSVLDGEALREIPFDMLDNLKGRMATALDEAWKQGFEDCKIENRLNDMKLFKGQQ